MFGAGWFFYLAALPVVVCTVVTGLLWLPSKSTGWFVRLDVGLAWVRAAWLVAGPEVLAVHWLLHALGMAGAHTACASTRRSDLEHNVVHHLGTS